MILIELTEEEWQIAIEEAQRRARVNSKDASIHNQRGTSNASPVEIKDWEMNGCGAELATSIFLYGHGPKSLEMWSGRGGTARDRRSDVRPNIEVKWTGAGKLFLKEYENGRRYYGPHAVWEGDFGRFRGLGWWSVTPRDYSEHEIDPSQPRYPSRWIPARELLPMETLYEYVHGVAYPTSIIVPEPPKPAPEPREEQLNLW